MPADLIQNPDVHINTYIHYGSNVTYRSVTQMAFCGCKRGLYNYTKCYNIHVNSYIFDLTIGEN